MENASKALLMAGGILLGVLIMALIVTLFINSRQVSTRYETNKQELAVQQFNTNFTKYLGQRLTIYDVITIRNFAMENGVEITDYYKNITISENESNVYKLNITNNDYDTKGYIKRIWISKILL